MVEPAALTTLSQLCDGDARSALNGLELSVHAKRTRQSSLPAEQIPLNTRQITTSTGTSSQTALELSRHTSTAEIHSTEVSGNQDTRGHLQNTINSSQSSSIAVVSVQDVLDSLQRSHLLYDRAGEEHYNIISALHKSMRGGDANASLYWLARMLCAGEDPLYVARRVVCFASEDIGE